MNSEIKSVDPIDLSVIMVTWNSLEVTAAALRSLVEQTHGIRYEVFLVDNGTTKDDTLDVIPKLFPTVKLIANTENLGFTKANNQGLRLAQGRYVLLLNNDTIQREDALSKAVHYLDKNADVGIIGIKHLNNDADRTFQPSFFSFPSAYQDTWHLLVPPGRKTLVPPVAPLEMELDVDWVCGSFLMMRRECLTKIGLLDERYFIYDEDIDWCLQAHRAGWKVRFWQGTSMIHLGAASNPLMRDKTLVMFRSHLSYLRKNHGVVAAGMYYAAKALQLWGAVTKQAVRCGLGRAPFADVKQRLGRFRSFLTLRPGKVGG